jgi:hypothetical protein
MALSNWPSPDRAFAAAKYRRLAKTAEDPLLKQEFLDLAAVCEEAADNLEDRQTSDGLRT